MVTKSGFYHAKPNPFIGIRKTLPQIATPSLQDGNKILIFIEFLKVVAFNTTFNNDNSTLKKTFRFGKLNSIPIFWNKNSNLFVFQQPNKPAYAQ